MISACTVINQGQKLFILSIITLINQGKKLFVLLIVTIATETRLSTQNQVFFCWKKSTLTHGDAEKSH